MIFERSLIKGRTNVQWRGNYLWRGGGGRGQNRERQIDEMFIEFGPRFCPRNKHSLKNGLRRIWTAFLSQK